MKKNKFATICRGDDFSGKRIFSRLSSVVITGLAVLGAAGIAAGQGKPDKLELGVIYTCEEMNHYEFKVISCDDKDWCQVFIVNKAAPHGGNVTGEGKATVLSTIEKNACVVKGRPPAAKSDPGPAEDKAKDKNGNPGNPPDPAPAQDAPNAAASCTSDPGLATKPKTGDAMELNSKRAILARFHQSVEKGEKLAVGISFASFQIGPPRANRRGDPLYFQDAPVGANLYPVKSQFTLCSRFSTEITRDVVDGRYECFQDNFGEWVCATASGYRIINTKYEKLKK